VFARVIPSIWGVSKKVFGILYNSRGKRICKPQIYTDLAAKPQFKVLPTDLHRFSRIFLFIKKQIATNFPQIFLQQILQISQIRRRDRRFLPTEGGEAAVQSFAHRFTQIS
jgi:hypothetical protein